MTEQRSHLNGTISESKIRHKNNFALKCNFPRAKKRVNFNYIVIKAAEIEVAY